MQNHTNPRPGSRRAHVLQMAAASSDRPDTLTAVGFKTALELVPGVEVHSAHVSSEHTVHGEVTDASGQRWGYTYDGDLGRVDAGVADVDSWSAYGATDFFLALSPTDKGVSNDDTLADEGAHFASTPEPVESSERVDLGEGHADVDAVEGHVDLTAHVGRSGFGISLTPIEAQRIGEALVTAAERLTDADDDLRAAEVTLDDVHTVADLCQAAESADVPPSAIMRRLQDTHTTV